MIAKRIFGILVLVFLSAAVYAQSDKVDVLLQKLKDADHIVREKAIYELGDTNDNRAVDALFAIMLDKNDKKRFAAAYALARMSDHSVVDRLIAELNNDKDKDWGSIFYPVLALQSSKDPRATEFFNAAIKNKSIGVIAANHEYYIIKGEAGTEDLLIGALNKYGDLYNKMAINLYICDNQKLSSAAKKWIESKGMSIEDLKEAIDYFSCGKPIWGRGYSP